MDSTLAQEKPKKVTTNPSNTEKSTLLLQYSASHLQLPKAMDLFNNVENNICIFFLT